MKNILSGLLLLLASIATSVYISACGSEDSTASVSGTSYAGPGSKWGVTLNSNATFVITHAADAESAVDLTVNGTYETTTSGFLKLTVTSSVGTDGPDAGEQAYALNVPGFVFLLKPLDPTSEIIPMVVTGTCPTGSQSFNWMVTNHEASGEGVTLEDNKDLLGQATFNGTDELEITSQFDLEGDDITMPNNTVAGSCANGVISLPTNTPPATIYLSSAGAALVDLFTQGSGTATEADDKHNVIVAMPQDTITDMANLDGNYIGLVFNDNGGGDKTSPIWATFNASATNTAGEFTDVDAGTKGAANVTIAVVATDSPANGFFRANITIGADTAPMSCQVTLDAASSGKNIIFCVGIEPESVTANSDQLYTVLLVSE